MSVYRRLTLEGFKAWLKTKHRSTKVGHSCQEDFCPLAKFLTQTTGVPHRVDGDTYCRAKVDENGKIVKDSGGYVVYEEDVDLPQWAEHFIDIVDEEYSDYVSAAAALKIVESNTLGRAAQMGM